MVAKINSHLYEDAYSKVAYSCDNGYEMRAQKLFKSRRLKGKSQQRKMLISTGNIQYFVKDAKEKRKCQKDALRIIMANTSRILIPKKI